MSSLFGFMFHHCKVSTKCRILNLTMTLRLTAEVETGLIPEIVSISIKEKIRMYQRIVSDPHLRFTKDMTTINNFACVLDPIIKSQPSFREPGSVKWRHSVDFSDLSSKSNFYRKATTLIVRQDIF